MVGGKGHDMRGLAKGGFRWGFFVWEDVKDGKDNNLE